tara:strand:- start:1071 stop:1529 length:459 start_codon:yes stop_codon:yes gene_type:complete
MNDDFQPATVQAVQALYDANPHAKQLFDWTASLRRDAKETTIERIAQVLDISRKAAVSLAQELEESGCGEFIVGRRGSPSRFEWSYSRVSLGQVAAGEAEEIEEVSDPISEKEEEALGPEGSAQLLTISSAKVLLAKSLGLTPDQIEIQIRA